MDEKFEITKENLWKVTEYPKRFGKSITYLYNGLLSGNIFHARIKKNQYVKFIPNNGYFTIDNDM
jgi:hypothetical protein